jgi:hypothetical protein
MTALDTGLAAAEAGDAEAGGDRAHLLLGELLALAQALVDGGHHEVLEHLHVLGVHGGGVDDEPDQVLLAGDGRLDDAAARGSLDGGRLELLLDARHLLLHLHQHLLRVHRHGCGSSVGVVAFRVGGGFAVSCAAKSRPCGGVARAPARAVPGQVR